MKTILKIFGLAMAIQTGLSAIKTETVEYKEGDTTLAPSLDLECPARKQHLQVRPYPIVENAQVPRGAIETEIDVLTHMIVTHGATVAGVA